jgi:hypothetical protein
MDVPSLNSRLLVPGTFIASLRDDGEASSVSVQQYTYVVAPARLRRGCALGTDVLKLGRSVAPGATRVGLKVGLRAVGRLP